MIQLVLDTDIGTDVDDALALAVLLGSPEADLLGVTTVYGDTLLRARMARRLASIAGPEVDIPFVPGARETLSGRAVWWPGHEGALFDDLADEPVDPGGDAVSYLVETAAANPGQVDVLAIGPLTNIALCLRRDPDFARNVRRVVMMGGDFSADRRIVEHNFRCDATAAREVFDSDLRITVAGLNVTTQLALAQPEIDRIQAAGPLGVALRAEIEQFWQFHGKPWNNPHDPVAALTLLRPDLFGVQSQTVRILAEGDQAGLVVSDPGQGRVVEVVTDLDCAGVVHEIVERIVAAAASPDGTAVEASWSR